MEKDRKCRATPPIVLVLSILLPGITQEATVRLSFFFAGSCSRFLIERGETRKIVNAKDERLSCQLHPREIFETLQVLVKYPRLD